MDSFAFRKPVLSGVEVSKGAEEAMACFQQAIDVARKQEGKSWELRAVFIAEIAPEYGWQYLETGEVRSPLTLYVKSDERVNSTATQGKIEGKPRTFIRLTFCDDISMYDSRPASHISWVRTGFRGVLAGGSA